MKYLITFLIALMLATPCDAGKYTASRLSLRHKRIDSGVALTRARTRLYVAQSVCNVTGVFSPFGLIANLLGR